MSSTAFQSPEKKKVLFKEEMIKVKNGVFIKVRFSLPSVAAAATATRWSAGAAAAAWTERRRRASWRFFLQSERIAFRKETKIKRT